jgi:hypothetical protein
MRAAEARVADTKAAGSQPVPVVIASKATFTAQDLAKYRKLEAGPQSLRTAGSDDRESWLIVGVAAVFVGGAIAYGHFYHSGAGAAGGGGY